VHVTDTTDPQRAWLDSLRDPLPALAILAGLRLDLFTQIGTRPQSVTELATAMAWDERRLDALLRALVALYLVDILEAQGDPRFLCTPVAARWLCSTSPEFDGQDRDLAPRLWAAGLTVAASIRMGQSTAPHAVGGGTADTAAFLQGLHPAAIAAGRRLGRLGWLDDCRDVIDVGGGSGGLALLLCSNIFRKLAFGSWSNPTWQL
jgi:hypothetical protein